jgi:signal transduction histidine kinase
LSRDKAHVTLAVRDDGRGFDPARVAAYEGHGLRNMDARARALGGKLLVESALGKGTIVKAIVPMEPIGGRGT